MMRPPTSEANAPLTHERAQDASVTEDPTIELAGHVHWYRFAILLFLVSLGFVILVITYSAAAQSLHTWSTWEKAVVPPLVLGSLGGLTWYAWWLVTYGAWLTSTGIVIQNGRTTYHYAYSELAEIKYTLGRTQSSREHLILTTHPEFGFRRTTFLYLYFSNAKDLVKSLIQNALARNQRVVVDPYLLQVYGQPPYEIASEAPLDGVPPSTKAPTRGGLAPGFPVLYRRKIVLTTLVVVFFLVIAGWLVKLAAGTLEVVLNPSRYWFSGNGLVVFLNLAWPIGYALFLPFMLLAASENLGTRVALTEDGIWVRRLIGKPRRILWSEVSGVYRQTTGWDISTAGRPTLLDSMRVYSPHHLRLSNMLIANESEFMSTLVTNVTRANPGAELVPDLATIYAPSTVGNKREEPENAVS